MLLHSVAIRATLCNKLLHTVSLLHTVLHQGFFPYLETPAWMLLFRPWNKCALRLRNSLTVLWYEKSEENKEKQLEITNCILHVYSRLNLYRITLPKTRDLGFHGIIGRNCDIQLLSSIRQWHWQYLLTKYKLRFNLYAKIIENRGVRKKKPRNLFRQRNYTILCQITTTRTKPVLGPNCKIQYTWRV